MVVKIGGDMVKITKKNGDGNPVVVRTEPTGRARACVYIYIRGESTGNR